MQIKTIAITSPDNARFKFFKTLWDNHKRKKSGCFFAEGLKEISMAIREGFELTDLFVSNDQSEKAEGFMVENNLLNVPLYLLSDNLLKTIMYREKTEGVTAVFKQKNLKLSEVKLNKSSLVIVLESVEKPGNLGAVIRTADACNADAIIVCDPRTDIYNPNVIRSSVGCVFSKQVVVCSNQEAADWLILKKFQLITTLPEAKQNLYEIDYSKNVAVVFGTEADGLTDFWKMPETQPVRIPMLGVNDSLNVSVSVAVVCYEVLRRTQFEK
ncbi:MAG: rRNA methyltransferase [Bacteroidetes bacterium HGW-Bacteroidetes-21]|jgi:TrmH family RNA methyltransferase|nr:MAG: rRNA methyltransferase [Bacteroidetes bacterium HGW-Bacteroidetes-21]